MFLGIPDHYLTQERVTLPACTALHTPLKPVNEVPGHYNEVDMGLQRCAA